ncbi:MAG: hypothetical protein K6G10_06855 [Butyrivibrio sp.]|nr:hypothetical protein [Butyrivibrio sp.]
MNTRRMESMKLMPLLQPLTQLGYLSAGQAKNVIDEYKEGNTEPLRSLCLDPSLPTSLSPILERIRQYI